MVSQPIPTRFINKKRGLKSGNLLIDGRRKPIDEKNAG